jgi:hypothetical protein
MRVFALRLTMPAHYLTTGSIVALAAGLGALAEPAGDHLPAANRWVLCAGAALYFLTAAVVGARGGAGRGWILLWALPAVAASVLLGLFGGALPPWALAGVLLVVALWHVAYRQVDPGPGTATGGVHFGLDPGPDDRQARARCARMTP